MIVDLGNNAEAILTREHLILKKFFALAIVCAPCWSKFDLITADLSWFYHEQPHQMLIELFKVEVPEIAEDVIQILGAARDPGSRAKIAVQTNDGA